MSDTDKVKILKRQLGELVDEEPQKEQDEEVWDTYKVRRGRVIKDPEGGIMDWAWRTSQSQEITEEDAMKLIGFGIEVEKKLSNNPAIGRYPKVIYELINSTNDDVVADSLRWWVVAPEITENLNRDVWFRLYEKIRQTDQLIGNNADIAMTLFDKKNLSGYDDEFVCDVVSEFLRSKNPTSDVRGGYGYRRGHGSIEDVYGKIVHPDNGHIPEACGCDIRKLIVQKTTNHQNRHMALFSADDQCYCDMISDVDFSNGDVGDLKFNDICGCELAKAMMKTTNKHTKQNLASLDFPSACAEEIADIFAVDKDFRVRENIARNDHLSDDVRCKILGKLKNDHTQGVQQAIRSTKLPDKCGCEMYEEFIEKESPREENTYLRDPLHISNIPKKCRCDLAKKALDKNIVNVSGIFRDLEQDEDECKCEIIKYAMQTKKNLPTSYDAVGVPSLCHEEVVDLIMGDKSLFKEYGRFMTDSIRRTAGYNEVVINDAFVNKYLDDLEKYGVESGEVWQFNETSEVLFGMTSDAMKPKFIERVTKVMEPHKTEEDWLAWFSERGVYRSFLDRTKNEGGSQ